MFHDLCVCLLDTAMSCAKTAEPIEMSFGVWSRVSRGNHVLGGDPDPQGKSKLGWHLPVHCKV